MVKRNEFFDSPVWRKASSPVPEGLTRLQAQRFDLVKYASDIKRYITNARLLLSSREKQFCERLLDLSDRVLF